MSRIIYTNDDGTISIIVPAQVDNLTTVEELKAVTLPDVGV